MGLVPLVTPSSSKDTILAESPAVPGVPVVYRTSEERLANPDRLNLDRRHLTVCPILEVWPEDLIWAPLMIIVIIIIG